MADDSTVPAQWLDIFDSPVSKHLPMQNTACNQVCYEWQFSERGLSILIAIVRYQGESNYPISTRMMSLCLHHKHSCSLLQLHNAVPNLHQASIPAAYTKNVEPQ